MDRATWIRKEISDKNDDIVDLMKIDTYEYICNEKEDYYIVDPEEWEKALQQQRRGRNYKKERIEEHLRYLKCRELIKMGYDAKREGNIDREIFYFEESLKLGVRDVNPYCELAKIYKKNKDVDNELRVLRKRQQFISNDLHTQKRIRELEGTQPEVVCVHERCMYKSDEIPIGEKIYTLLSECTIADFVLEDDIEEESLYGEVGYDSITSEYYCYRSGYVNLKKEKAKIINNYLQELNTLKRKAREYEALEDYKSATEIYEKLIYERFPETEIYDSLIAIYRKFRLREAELAVLKEGIKAVEEDQKRYKSLELKILFGFKTKHVNVQEVCYGVYFGGVNSPYLPVGWGKRVFWLEERLNHKQRKILEQEETQPEMVNNGNLLFCSNDISIGERIFAFLEGCTKNDFLVEEYVEAESTYVDVGGNVIPTQNYGYCRVKISLSRDKADIINNYLKELYVARSKAQEYIVLGDYKSASEIYRNLLYKRYPEIECYKSLIAIYRKFRLREAELAVLKEGIKSVEENQKRYKSLESKVLSWYTNKYEKVQDVSFRIYFGEVHCPQLPVGWGKRVLWLEERLNCK